jgi:putative iron-dependent peroxidase
VTGCLFFVPSATFMESVTDDEPAVEAPAAAVAVEPSQSVESVHDGSLGIGSLKGDIRHE